MGRFQQAGRDGPAGVMPDPRIPKGPPISAAEAVAAFNRQRARGPDDFGERANAYRQRRGFEQQAGAGRRRARYRTRRKPVCTRADGRIGARTATAPSNPPTASGPCPRRTPSSAMKALEHEPPGPPSEHEHANDDDDDDDDAGSDRPGVETRTTSAEPRSTWRDAWTPSTPPSPRRAPAPSPPPGPNAGRWQNRAERRDPARVDPDVHAGRHEDRAFYGDGGDRNVWVPFEVRDADHGFARHAGRWEDRARWRDAPYLDSQKFVNHGHYAQHIGRDNWERGAYLRMDRGVHEGRWRDGVWDEGLWQRRARVGARSHASRRPDRRSARSGAHRPSEHRRHLGGPVGGTG